MNPVKSNQLTLWLISCQTRVMLGMLKLFNCTLEYYQAKQTKEKCGKREKKRVRPTRAEPNQCAFTLPLKLWHRIWSAAFNYVALSASKFLPTCFLCMATKNRDLVEPMCPKHFLFDRRTAYHRCGIFSSSHVDLYWPPRWINWSFGMMSKITFPLSICLFLKQSLVSTYWIKRSGEWCAGLHEWTDRSWLVLLIAAEWGISSWQTSPIGPRAMKLSL